MPLLVRKYVLLRKLDLCICAIKKRADLAQNADKIQTEIGWLRKELGSARDWDVLAESTLPKIGKELTEPAILNPVRKATQAKAAETHEKASAAVMSSRYKKLVLTFYGWVLGTEWRDSVTAAQREMLGKPITRLANKTLSRNQENLVKRGSRLKGANSEMRHRVRIAEKKTSDATKFFASLYSGKRVRPYIRTLSRFQNELGTMNDAAVATNLLHGLEIEPPEIATGTRFLRRYLFCRATSDDRELDRRWKQFKQMSLPCKKLRC